MSVAKNLLRICTIDTSVPVGMVLLWREEQFWETKTAAAAAATVVVVVVAAAAAAAALHVLSDC